MVWPTPPTSPGARAGPSCSEPSPIVAPELIIGLRHGEKPANAEDDHEPIDDSGPGLDGHGDVRPSSLTLRGWQRAGALAATHVCGLLQPEAVAPPVTILVPRYDHTKRHRPYQTIESLALKLGTEPEDVCAADDIERLTTRVSGCTGTAVVCWEHDALVAFARSLSDTAPSDWPKGRFDVLWLLRADRRGGYGWQQVDQNLLPGDAAGA